jgi:endonuclease YncB( thermonuclease family)
LDAVRPIQQHAEMRRCLLFSLLLTFAWGPAAHPTEVPRLAGNVVGVPDGDTVDVLLESGMVRVRLHAVDAPEHDQPHGNASRRELSRLVYRRAVELEPIEQDQYDRLVARLWVGDMDVNAELLKRGAAWVYRRYAHEAAYCAYEKSARDLGRGVWRLPGAQRVAPWEWRHRDKRRKPFTDYSDQSLADCIASLGK